MGLANSVAGGVFRCQLSCDSRQRSPSNRGCGVPSSLGWEAGREAAGEESEAELEGGVAGGLKPLALRAGGGPLRPRAHTVPGVRLHGAEGGRLPSVHTFYASMPCFSVLIRRSFIPFSGYVGKRLGWTTPAEAHRALEGAGHGALRGWGRRSAGRVHPSPGRSPDVRAPVS